MGRRAEEAVLSLPLVRGEEFEAFYGYLTVDEPAVHLMPVHFLPRSAKVPVSGETLLALGVTAKLEYARNRWLDGVVDVGCRGSVSAVHQLSAMLVDLILDKYTEILPDRVASRFLGTLAGLYARHGASLAVDGSPVPRATIELGEEDYRVHARSRHASFRASVDAVLLLSGASTEAVRRATESWHLWALGVQLWDDATDVEEDFESGNLTWTVARALGLLGTDAAENRRPDPAAFYEAALSGGALEETLTKAESCFRSAASLAEDEFPSWAAFQRACTTQTSRLRIDLQDLTSRIAGG